MNRKFFWVGTSILLVAVLAAAAVLIYQNTHESFTGSVIDPPAPASDFTLTSQNGTKVSLSDFRGKYVYLFFGYSHCTQECPATMAILSKARNLMGSQGADIQVIMVSTDPVGDTRQSVQEFLNRFDPTFIGGLGAQDQLQVVWKDYGVSVEAGGETHSSYTYLIDPNGNLRMTYPYGVTPEELVSDLKQLMRKN
jgi:protein SCO1/2